MKLTETQKIANQILIKDLSDQYEPDRFEYITNMGGTIISLKNVIVNDRLIPVVKENEEFWLIFDGKKYALKDVLKKRKVYFPSTIISFEQLMPPSPVKGKGRK